MAKEPRHFVKLDVEFFRDEKIWALRRRIGYEGVGIYLSLLSLHKKYAEYAYTIPLRLLDEIAEEDLIVASEKLKSTVDVCIEVGLFQLTEDSCNFYSGRLKNELICDEKTREKQSVAAFETNRKRAMSANRDGVA